MTNLEKILKVKSQILEQKSRGQKAISMAKI